MVTRALWLNLSINENLFLMLYVGNRGGKSYIFLNPVEGPVQDLPNNKAASMEISEDKSKADQGQKINRENQNEVEVQSGGSCDKPDGHFTIDRSL